MAKMANSFKLPPAKRSAPARWLISGLVLVSLIAFTSRKQAIRSIPDIKVVLTEQEGVHFVNAEQMHALVQTHVLDDIKKSGADGRLHLGRIERLLERNAFIHNAALSQALDGSLLLEIQQTRPIARIIGFRGSDYYVSQEGRTMLVSPMYTSRVMTLEGPGARVLIENNPNKDSAAKALFTFVSRLQTDPFWQKQIAGLEVNSRGEILLFPQVGQQVFEFGNTEESESKLKRLMAFYQHIMPTKGWSKYSFVSVKYKNQIVCQ